MAEGEYVALVKYMLFGVNMFIVILLYRWKAIPPHLIVMILFFSAIGCEIFVRYFSEEAFSFMTLYTYKIDTFLMLLSPLLLFTIFKFHCDNEK